MTETNINCPLCEIELNDSNIVRLSCNPDKHYFCYDCIENWFLTIIKNKNHMIQYKKRECPICRETTSFIPLLEGKKYIKNIHSIYYKNKEKEKDNNKDKDKNNLIVNEPIELCNHLLKTKNAHCKNKGRPEYAGFCGLHKSSANNN